LGARSWGSIQATLEDKGSHSWGGTNELERTIGLAASFDPTFIARPGLLLKSKMSEFICALMPLA
jgi:hypothetical protein